MVPVAIVHVLVLLIPLSPSIHTPPIKVFLESSTVSQEDVLWDQAEGFEEEDIFIICDPPDER